MKNNITSGGKKIRKARTLINKEKNGIAEAIKLVKNAAFAKFDETLNIAINLGIDPKQSDQSVRGVAMLPHGTGKTLRVAALCKAERHDEAIAAGADIVGSDNIIANIKEGIIDFDVCVATPDMMPLLASSVAKILGPKGLMPNPKSGTVAIDIATAVKNAKSGQVEFRNEKAGIIHSGIGKLSFLNDELRVNATAFVQAVIKAKPSSTKGVYVKSIHISSTMGPSVAVAVDSVS